jgi:hypothetical protein
MMAIMVMEMMAMAMVLGLWRTPHMRPTSADGRTARRAPARNFSTSRDASAHRSQKQ